MYLKKCFISKSLEEYRYVYSPYEKAQSRIILSTNWPYVQRETIDSCFPISKQLERFQKQQDKYPFYTSELYCQGDSQTLNVGASRSCQVGDILIKGNGNNRTSIRNDFLHSSGYMRKDECLSEYIKSTLLAHLSVHTQILEIREFSVGRTEKFFALIRLNKTFRIPTLLGLKQSLKEKGQLKKIWSDHFSVTNKYEAYRHTLKKVKELIDSGLYQRAMALDNFSIFGDLVDLDGYNIFDIEYKKQMIFYGDLTKNQVASDTLTSLIIFYFLPTKQIIDDTFSEGKISFETLLEEIFNDNENFLIQLYIKSKINPMDFHLELRQKGYYSLPNEIYLQIKDKLIKRKENLYTIGEEIDKIDIRSSIIKSFNIAKGPLAWATKSNLIISLVNRERKHFDNGSLINKKELIQLIKKNESDVSSIVIVSDSKKYELLVPQRNYELNKLLRIDDIIVKTNKGKKHLMSLWSYLNFE